MAIKSQVRKADPRVIRDKKQSAMVCPFCEMTHPIGLTPSACGTKVEIKAVQTVYTGATCSFCGKTGGKFVKVGNLYAHTPSCTPGKTLFSKPPKMSILAKVIHKMPDPVNKFLAQKFGVVTLEITNPTTKKILGYTFSRRPK